MLLLVNCRDRENGSWAFLQTCWDLRDSSKAGRGEKTPISGTVKGTQELGDSRWLKKKLVIEWKGLLLEWWTA